MSAPDVALPLIRRSFWKKELGLLLIFLTGSGCSLFIGSVKPVEERSAQYSVLDLSRLNSDWTRLQSENTSAPPDTTYQSKSTGSVISINSVCKNYTPHLNAQGPPDVLKASTQELLLGVKQVTLQAQKPLTLWNVPALQTTLLGKVDQQERMIEIVVLQKDNCTYDLMYVARPSVFQTKHEDFARFVSSLSLR